MVGQKMKCYLNISTSGHFSFGYDFNMTKGVRIDCEEFLLEQKVFIPSNIPDELEKAYKTVIRRLKLRS